MFRGGPSLAASLLAAADLLAARGGSGSEVTLDRAHAAAVFSLERLIRQDGEPITAWVELSGQYTTRDGGFVQLHCNFPHHAAGIAHRLGVLLARAAFEVAIAQWDAVDLETALIEAGMVGAAYRTLEQWGASCPRSNSRGSVTVAGQHSPPLSDRSRA